MQSVANQESSSEPWGPGFLLGVTWMCTAHVADLNCAGSSPPVIKPRTSGITKQAMIISHIVSISWSTRYSVSKVLRLPENSGATEPSCAVAYPMSCACTALPFPRFFISCLITLYSSSSAMLNHFVQRFTSQRPHLQIPSHCVLEFQYMNSRGKQTLNL